MREAATGRRVELTINDLLEQNEKSMSIKTRWSSGQNHQQYQSQYQKRCQDELPN